MKFYSSPTFLVFPKQYVKSSYTLMSFICGGEQSGHFPEGMINYFVCASPDWVEL